MTHMLEDFPPSGRAAPLLGEMAGSRLDNVEHGGGLPFVAGKGSALGQGIRNDDQPLGRELLDEDRTARRNLVVPFRGDLDDRRFLLVPGELALNPLTQAADDLVLFQGREAN